MSYRHTHSFDEQGNSLFHVDPLSAIEFLQTVRRRTDQDPERSLMLAVLQDAITCLEKYRAFGSGENRRLFDEARDWILSEDSDWLFSFNNICEAIGLNTRYLRTGLIQMTERRPAAPCVRKNGQSNQSASRRRKTSEREQAVRHVARLSSH